MNIWGAGRYSPREQIAYALLFLFPVAALTIEHWLSGIFTLLCLASLFFLRGRKERLTDQERRLLWLFAALFAAFALSNLVNGWGPDQTSALEEEIRFLLFIPLYLYLRDQPHVGPVLLKGTLVGAIVLGLQALYDSFGTGAARADGAYASLVFGGFALLLAVFSAIAWKVFEGSRWRWLVPFSFLGAWFALVTSGTRGAYVSALVVLLLFVAFNAHRRTSVLVLSLGIAFLGGTYALSDTASNRVDRAIQEVGTYMSLENPAEYEGRLFSSGVRLELWKAGWLMFKEHPVLGVGAENFNRHLAKQIDAGLVNPQIGRYAHAHNVYIHLLATKGIVGLGLFAGIMLYAAWMFARGVPGSRTIPFLGLVHIAAIACLSVTDANPLLKGNYVAIYVIYLATFMAWHMQMTALVRQPARSDSSTDVKTAERERRPSLVPEGA